ncbi:MAG: DNA repair protein RecO [Steroidobacteraceae bacterium]
MSRSRSRIQLAALYVLHHRPWRDTSRMLEVFARDHGRLTLFARGVRGANSRTASLLQPFQPLLGSWSARGDTGQLTQVEPMGEGALPAGAMLSAWYLNELLLQLTVRNDPQPAVFDLYHATLGALRTGEPVQPVLRRFERHLLELLGYGIDFAREARDGKPLSEATYYHFHADLGFVAISGSPPPTAFGGRVLLAMAADSWEAPEVGEEARRLMRLAIDHALEGRELRSRTVARSVARSTRERDDEQ